MTRNLLILLIFCTSLTLRAQLPVQFNHAYGTFSYNYGVSVYQEPDTGYVILANVSGNQGNNNVQLFKISKTGGYVWSQLYDDSALFRAEAFCRTPDHGYLITGSTNKNQEGGYNLFVYKTDSLGHKEWERYYGGADWDLGAAVESGIDGNYIICGNTYSYGNGQSDIYLLQINPQGDTLWTRTFGGPDEDIATSINICNNGDILIAGHTLSYGQGAYDALLLRYDNDGNYRWHKTYGGSGDEKIYGVRERFGSNIILGGYTSSFGMGGDDFYLIFADSLGNEVWHKADGGPDNEQAYTLALTADSGYVLCGLTAGPGYKDVYFYKMKPDGQWHYSTSHGSIYDDYASCIRQTYDTGYIIVGSTSSFGGCLSNVYVVKTDITGMSVPYNSIFEPHNNVGNVMSVYPNPTHGFFTVQILTENTVAGLFVISNLFGQEVLRHTINLGDKNFSLQPEHLPAGIYHYQWFSGNALKTAGKLVVY